VKRIALIGKIYRAATTEGKEFALIREGANHSIFQCGGRRVVIPRHREINEQTARAIMRDLDDQLGRDWWK
jgi:mRNA interferase HicA